MIKWLIKIFSPNIKDNIFFLLLFFLVKLDPSHFDGMKNSVDFHSFPLGRHEPSLGWDGVVHWVDELALIKLDLIMGVGHMLVDELASSDSPHNLELFIGDLDVLLIKFILDDSPPVRVFAFFDELIKAII